MQLSITCPTAAILMTAGLAFASTDGGGNYWGVCLSNQGGDQPWGECYYDSDNLNELDAKLKTACASDDACPLDGTPCYHDAVFGPTECNNVTPGTVP